MQDESSRKDENLKYSCKCSFLEIYNEQITDLLEPSSTNLQVNLAFAYLSGFCFCIICKHYGRHFLLTVQLREDLKKGVYVENLREFGVETVKDVVDLLFQVERSVIPLKLKVTRFMY